MTKHYRLPWNWKLVSFDWDMSMAEQLYKLGWNVKKHD